MKTAVKQRRNVQLFSPTALACSCRRVRSVISLDDLVQDLKGLTPEQLQQVAQVVHGFSSGGKKQNGLFTRQEMPKSLINQGIQHGWPRELFTDLIGSLPKMERAPQPPYTIREDR